MEAPENKRDWKKYPTTLTKGEANEEKRGKSKMVMGRVPARHAQHDREFMKNVKHMPLTDNFGDFGMYPGQVDDEGCPDGKVKINYDNGVFYEGTWMTADQNVIVLELAQIFIWMSTGIGRKGVKKRNGTSINGEKLDDKILVTDLLDEMDHEEILEDHCKENKIGVDAPIHPERPNRI